jgi:ATP-binding cassette subfamily B protein
MAEKRYGDLTIYKRLMKQARPYWLHIAGIFLLGLVGTPLLLLTPVPLKIAVDSVISSGPLPSYLDPFIPDWIADSKASLLVVAAVLQVLVVLLIQAQQLFTYILRAKAGEGLTLQFRSMMFRHAQRLSLLYHDMRGTTDSLYRIQNDAPAVREITMNSLVTLSTSMIMLVITVFVILRIDWQLGLVALIVVPALSVWARYYSGRMRGRYRSARVLESNAIQVVQEVLTAFRVVKAFGMEDREHDRFVDRSGLGVRARIRLAFYEGGFGLLVNLTTAIGTAAVLYLGIRNVQSGALTLGELLMVLAYVAQLYDPLRTISRNIATLQSSFASAERSFELLDEVPDVVDGPNPVSIERAAGRIELRDVSFAYGGNPPILSDVSFAIEPGTRLGITGVTGAGKTTLVSLVSRFFDPTEGRIYLDGVDIRNYKLDDIRRQFAIVLQEPVLFSATIRENISYARPEASEREIIEAARSANVHGFIEGLAEGYETLVGERGMRLSGGERQRIALARAFLKDAPILILDEPTSSVDTSTESGVMDAMTRLMRGRTTLMIAHRLGTLEICDARIEIDNGSIVEASGSVILPGLPTQQVAD